MCYVRCKWSREVESCKKQTTVYRRRVRHSHFNFSQMMMMTMILGQMSFIPPTPPLHPYLHILKTFFCPHEGLSTPKKFLQKVRHVNPRRDQHHLNVDMLTYLFNALAWAHTIRKIVKFCLQQCSSSIMEIFFNTLQKFHF